MPANDFRSYAKPWLDKLVEDPEKSDTLSQLNASTFPVGEIDWDDNQAKPIENDKPLDADVKDEDIAAARSARGATGLDVLAFYKSFRFIDRPPFYGRWGIFLLDAGIEGLALDLIELAPSLSMPEARQFSTEILLAHERYHFWIDAWAFGQEITPLTQPIVKRWEYYLAAKHCVELTPYDYEESLANHYLFKRLSRRRFSNRQRAEATLRKILLNGPSPYSDFDFSVTERIRREGVLASAVANGLDIRRVFFESVMTYGAIPTVLSASIQPVDRIHPIVGVHLCPTYQVQTSGYAAIISPFQGPTIRIFRQFLTNYLAGKEEGATDHLFYRIDNNQKIKCPNPHDKEVRGYELKGTLFKAGMTQQEFKLEENRTDKWKKNCPRSPVKPSLDQN